MIHSLLNFLQMGGYGWYVWSAYGIVTSFLFLQWFIPWFKWKKYLRKQNSS